MNMNFFRRIELLFTVCVTGTAVLIIEVLATRMLSPYFGNTIFSVSSVITVVLFALSVGYYIGGKKADNKPSKKIFYLIIFFGGLSTILISIIYIYILPSIGLKLPFNYGPLLVSLVLFFLPSFLLGMLSPYAIKLEYIQNPNLGIGSISGRVFFWSTFGSILGSLITGFILVPNLGVSVIIVSVGLFLILFSALMLLFISKKNSLYIICAIAIAVLVFFCSKNAYSNENLIFTHDGIYEKISITKRIYNNKPILLFTQDRSASSAMYEEDPYKLVFPYTTYYELYKLFKPTIDNALVIGGGAYSIPKVLLKEGNINSKIYVSEIEPSLLDIAKKFFALPDDNRLVPTTEDGRQFLKGNNIKYDMIFSDVYFSYFSIPVHFTTKEFFQLAKSRLSDNGIFVANLAGNLSRQNPSFVFSEIKTFQEIFPNSYFFAVDSAKGYRPQNIMMLGINGNKKIDLENAKKIAFNNFEVESFDNILDLSRYNLDMYTELTDEYSPVENMLKPIITSATLDNEVHSDEIMALIKSISSFGPRTQGNEASIRTRDLISSELQANGIKVVKQDFQYIAWDNNSYTFSNIIGQIHPEIKQRIILGTHYDTKNYPYDKELSFKNYVPGANNGASGVAVLLEIGRLLKQIDMPVDLGIDLVFFDGEEGDPGITNDFSKWKPIGSEYFAQHLSDIYGNTKPQQGVIIDMVCDKDLTFYKDSGSVKNSNKEIENFWQLGKKLYPSVFRDDEISEIRDDNTSLSSAGIPSFLVIDYNYPYIYTTQDSPDKCSVKSLDTITNTLINYIDQL